MFVTWQMYFYSRTQPSFFCRVLSFFLIRHAEKRVQEKIPPAPSVTILDINGMAPLYHIEH